MKKYMYVFSTNFKTKKVALMDTLLSMVGYIVITYVLIELWKYIYGASGYGSVLNGYTMNQMLWHLVIAEFIQSCAHGKKCVKAVSNDVKSGAVAYKLNKPYDYYTYTYVTYFSDAMWTYVFYLPLCFIMGGVFIGDFSSISLVGLVPCLISFILATLVIYGLYMLVALIAFWVEDATPFAWVVQKVLFMCGMLFPIEFLPTVIQPFIRYSPIYGIYSGPAKVIANFSWKGYFTLVASQVFWIVVLYILGRFIYSRAKRRVNVNGG